MIPNNIFSANQGVDLNKCIGIDGVNGARLFQTTPNSRIPVFDAEEDYVYIISTDAANNKTDILRFHLEPAPISTNLPANLNPDILTKEDLQQFKEEILNDVRNVIQQSIQPADSTANKTQQYKANDANGKDQRKS